MTVTPIAGERVGGTLILLVGANTLPNYLAARTLRPERVLLLWSPATQLLQGKLEKVLGDRLGVAVDGRHVRDAGDAAAVIDACRDLPADARLNYTGGTKIMAAHARLAFQAAGGRAAHASYVDAVARSVRFDDGYRTPLPREGLDLDTLLALHATEQVSQWAAREGGPGEHDATALAVSILGSEAPAAFADRLYRLCHRRPAEVRDDPIDLGGLGLHLSVPSVPQPGWTSRQIRPWLSFLEGTWLDVWTAERMRAARCGAGVHVGVHVRRHTGRDFELDAVAVGGDTVHVLSCTTEAGLGRAKLKAFEVALRARHLGGDLARSALACFLPAAERDELQADVEASWDQVGAPQVFGVEHLRAWSAGDLSSLAAWLDI